MSAALPAPLDRRVILGELERRGIVPPALDVLAEAGSTNRYLRARAAALAPGAACLAETQAEGRGRRGRRWIATPYANLMLSLLWRFEGTPAALSGLGLAAGLAVLRALEDYGVRDPALKWPNDILWHYRKLAGVLVEVDGARGAPACAVIGVGVNGYIAPVDGAAIDQPWTDLVQITGRLPDRNRLAALTIARLVDTCRGYAASGFERFRPEWERRHVFHGRAVRLADGAGVHDGVVAGIDANGALRLRTAGGETVFHAGDVSLRAPAEGVS